MQCLKVDTSKSSGPDEISSMMLKSTAFSIAPSLTTLFNNSLTEGALPADWKPARVVPVPQSDSIRNSVSGYRLISILPTVSKILEHHVGDIILDRIPEAYPIKWGLHHRSSTSALISVIFDWLSALDNGQETFLMCKKLLNRYHTYPYCKSWNK